MYRGVPHRVRLRVRVSGRNLENPRSPILTSKSTERRSSLDRKSDISLAVKEMMSAVVNTVPPTATGDFKSIRMFGALISRCRIPVV